MMPDPSKIPVVLGGILAVVLIQTRPALAQAEPDPPSGALVRIQSAHAKDLAAGKFLVASRDLPDPNFSQTVVLLIQYDEQGAVGLILNRRTKVLLSEALPDVKGMKGRSDAVYLGGPVGPAAALALIRSQTKPADARLILADIYLTASRAVLEKNLVSGSPESVHVYVGYAGWTAEQLRREVALGAWFIFPGDAATVFDANPESIWSRWILKTEGQIASAPVRYTGCQLGFVAAEGPALRVEEVLHGGEPVYLSGDAWRGPGDRSAKLGAGAQPDREGNLKTLHATAAARWPSGPARHL